MRKRQREVERVGEREWEKETRKERERARQLERVKGERQSARAKLSKTESVRKRQKDAAIARETV